jgi:hypothetical protein
MDSKTIGKYVVWAGIILAVVFAIWPEPADWAPWLLVLLGLVGGYMWVAKEDETQFFIMVIALHLFNDVLYQLPTIGNVFGDIFSALALFLGAAAIAVVVRIIVNWFR